MFSTIKCEPYFKVKVVGQRSRSNAKNGVLTSLLPWFKVKVIGRGQGLSLVSRSKVKVKVMGKGQRPRSDFLHAAVNSRGPALPSAAKSNKSHYQSKVFFCMWDVVDQLLFLSKKQTIFCLQESSYVVQFAKPHLPGILSDILLTSNTMVKHHLFQVWGKYQKVCHDSIECACLCLVFLLCVSVHFQVSYKSHDQLAVGKSCSSSPQTFLFRG